LQFDDEGFCRAAWRRIAARPVAPDIVHAHALYQAARLRHDNIPVLINFPGAPHARYEADIRQADALVADGWAAVNLPSMVGRPVHAIPKGVDAERFRPDGPDMRATFGLAGRRLVLSVGRFVPIKNMALLLAAPARMRQVAAADRSCLAAMRRRWRAHSASGWATPTAGARRRRSTGSSCWSGSRGARAPSGCSRCTAKCWTAAERRCVSRVRRPFKQRSETASRV